MNKTNCAVIGAGNLGEPIARRLMAQGHDVLVCDHNEDRLASLAARGARITREAADCATVPVILVLVATEAQLRAVVTDIANARAANAPAGHLAIMSTVPASVIEEMAALLVPTGLYVVDAPCSGGASRAAAGRLTIMAGAARQDLNVLCPIFNAMADNVFHVGGLGAGQTMKIVNNILCHANTTLTAEAVRLGMQLGLTPEAMAQTMEVSSGRNWLTAHPDLVQQTFADLSANRPTFDGLLSILKKDTKIAAAMTSAEVRNYPMIAGTARLINDLGEETWETWRRVGANPGNGEPA